MNSLPKPSAKGFTIVELLITVVVVGIIAVILMAKFSDNTEKARITADFASLRSIESAADVFLVERGALLPMPGTAGAWQGSGTKYTSGLMTLDERAEFLRALNEGGFLTLMSAATGPIDLSNYAQSTSGLGLTFTIISGDATLKSGHLLIPGAAGDVRVRIQQAGNSSYASADPIDLILTIGSNAGTFGVLKAEAASPI